MAPFTMQQVWAVEVAGSWAVVVLTLANSAVLGVVGHLDHLICAEAFNSPFLGRW